MVNSKLLVGDVTAAVIIIASDDSVITPTSEVVTALRLKHPPSPLDLHPPPTEPVTQTSSVSEEEVMVVLKSFRPSSAGGVDGLQPGHLKDMVAPQTAEAGRRLLKALANPCSKLISETGVQQGDPLGPVLFALAVDEIARSVRSTFGTWTTPRSAVQRKVFVKTFVG